MPVFKVPVRHRFGILPLPRAEEILAGRDRPRNVQRENNYKRSLVEIDSTFIAKYNDSCESDKRRLDEVLRRALQHAKFKAKPKRPSSSCDDLDTSDVQKAWEEMVVICQCNGSFEEEALVELAASLALVPISPSQVPSLLHIAGMSYQWLKRDELDGPLLRSGELLLLKILYLVSLRIYVYHLNGALPTLCTKEEVEQFKSDLEGFENREWTYRNFPEPLLHWKVALEVGLLVCECFAHSFNGPTLLSMSSLGNAEGSSCMEDLNQNTATELNVYDVPKKGHSSLHPTLWHALDVWQCVRQGSALLDESLRDLLACSSGFDAEHWMDSMLAMDILCAAAEVNIKVLRFVQDLADGRAKEYYEQHAKIKLHPSCEGRSSQAASSLEAEGTRRNPKKGARFDTPARDSKMKEDDFKETSKLLEQTHRIPVTLNILGMQPNFKEADLWPTNPEIMTATPSKLKVTFVSEESPSVKPFTPESVRTQSLIENESIPNTPVSDVSSSTDVDLRKSRTPTVSRDLTTNSLHVTSPPFVTWGHRRGRSSATLTAGTAASAALSTPTEEKLLSLLTPSALGPRDGEDPPESAKAKKGESRCTHYTHSIAALSGWGGEGGGRGSEIPPSTVCAPSFVSLPQELGSDELAFNSRFESWPSEVCTAYTVNMASITIYGRTSAIQDAALTGRHASGVTSKHGLVQLAGFERHQDDQDVTGLPSWAVRFVAILGLSRVSRICTKMNLKDGLSTVAWDRLMEAHSMERDKRVMEAYKLRQVSTDIDSCLLQSDCQHSSLPVIAYTADVLSHMFLPSVTPITRPIPCHRQRTKSELISCPNQKTSDVSAVLPKVDTGLSEARSPPSSNYITRTTKVLQSVAEEHWRRQMNTECAEEEKIIQGPLVSAIQETHQPQQRSL